MDLQTEITWLGISFGYIAVGFALVLLSKFLKDLLTPYRLDVELSHKDNVALGLAITGYFAGVLIIFLGAAVGPSPDEVPQAVRPGNGTRPDPSLCSCWNCDVEFQQPLDRQNGSLQILDAKRDYRGSKRGNGVLWKLAAWVANGLVIAGAIHGDGRTLPLLWCSTSWVKSC